MERQAPRLIKEIRQRFKAITQKRLAHELNITQQAVSEYKLGKVERERYDVIKKLEGILAHGLPLPDAHAVIEHEIQHGPSAGGDDKRGTTRPKKKGAGAIPPRRTKDR